MSKIVITGGAGFIGSHIAERCVRDGHEVVIIDNMDDYYSPALKKKNIDYVSKFGTVTFIHGDITNLEFLDLYPWRYYKPRISEGCYR
jgi:nucleoside-diphosphate-sugar epimerase